jgi:hypothetical protein
LLSIVLVSITSRDCTYTPPPEPPGPVARELGSTYIGGITESGATTKAGDIHHGVAENAAVAQHRRPEHVHARTRARADDVAGQHHTVVHLRRAERCIEPAAASTIRIVGHDACVRDDSRTKHQYTAAKFRRAVVGDQGVGHDQVAGEDAASAIVKRGAHGAIACDHHARQRDGGIGIHTCATGRDATRHREAVDSSRYSRIQPAQYPATLTTAPGAAVANASRTACAFVLENCVVTPSEAKQRSPAAGAETIDGAMSASGCCATEVCCAESPVSSSVSAVRLWASWAGRDGEKGGMASVGEALFYGLPELIVAHRRNEIVASGLLNRCVPMPIAPPPCGRPEKVRLARDCQFWQIVFQTW